MPKTMLQEMTWYDFWAGGRPSLPPELPFRIVPSGEGEWCVDRITGSFLFECRRPPLTVLESIPLVTAEGMFPVKQWTNARGLSIGFSVPGSKKALYLSDDYAVGRFYPIGVKVMEGVAFGSPVTVYDGDVGQTARFVGAHGFKRKYMEIISYVMDANPVYPHKLKKLENLWGKSSEFADMPTKEVLQRLQGRSDSGPEHVLKTTKTVQIVYDHMLSIS